MLPTSIPHHGPDDIAPHEAIKRDAHALAMAGTQRSAATVPVPDAWTVWSRDLRRGRLSVLGGFFRFVDLLAARDMDMGRTLALALLDLARAYVDMALPERRPAVVERRVQIMDITERRTERRTELRRAR